MKRMRSESFDIGEGAKVSQAVMDWFQIIGRFLDKHVEDFTGNLLAVNPQHYLAPGARPVAERWSPKAKLHSPGRGFAGKRREKCWRNPK
ncbi:MAG: hypothetical protein JXR78_10950 [Victivallales bacterium]|nr:hypothetical protein [Victivallales bacterium]